MNKQFKVLTLIAAVGLSGAASLLPAVAGAAPVLPDPYYMVAISDSALSTTQQIFAAPGTYTFGGASTTVIGLPVPSLTGHTVGGGSISSLESILRYSFAVDGPLNNVSVPLFITATASATSTSVNGNGGALAGLSVHNDPYAISSVILASMGAQSGDPAGNYFSGTLPFNWASGWVGGVSMQIDVTSFPGGVADAFVDPFIFIDPDFLSSHPGYSVIVSAGIGNAPVPVPAAVWLFGSGLLGLIGVARRKTRAA